MLSFDSISNLTEIMDNIEPGMAAFSSAKRADNNFGIFGKIRILICRKARVARSFLIAKIYRIGGKGGTGGNGG